MQSFFFSYGTLKIKICKEIFLLHLTCNFFSYDFFPVIYSIQVDSAILNNIINNINYIILYYLQVNNINYIILYYLQVNWWNIYIV